MKPRAINIIRLLESSRALPIRFMKRTHQAWVSSVNVVKEHCGYTTMTVELKWVERVTRPRKQLTKR